MNLQSLFEDFNPSRFLVYCCLLAFTLLFSLRLDGVISWNYWVVFLPLWIWKFMVIVGAVVGSYVWWTHPQYRCRFRRCVVIFSTGSEEKEKRKCYFKLSQQIRQFEHCNTTVLSVV